MELKNEYSQTEIIRSQIKQNSVNVKNEIVKEMEESKKVQDEIIQVREQSQ